MSSQLHSKFILVQAVSHILIAMEDYILFPSKLSIKVMNLVANEIHFVIAYFCQNSEIWYIRVLLDEPNIHAL